MGGSKKGRISRPSPKKGARFSSEEPRVNYDTKPPIFSLERLQNGKYCLQSMDKNGKASFAEAIFKRKNLDWKDIKKLDRHGLGFEKIAKSSLKVGMPPFITDDFDDFLAFRFDGFKPMVGYRKLDIFYVLWFDHDFTLYDH